VCVYHKYLIDTRTERADRWCKAVSGNRRHGDSSSVWWWSHKLVLWA